MADEVKQEPYDVKKEKEALKAKKLQEREKGGK